MKTGMLIINYNDYPSTKHLLDQVRSYSSIDEVVVVDNCSTDDSLRRLRRVKMENFTVLSMDKNYGYSRAINEGSRYLIQKLGKCNLIISNADIVLCEEEKLKKMLSLLKEKSVGVVGPTVLEHGMVNHGWKNPTPWVDCLMNLPYIHRYIREKYIFYPANYYGKETTEVEVLSGCFFAIKSKTLEEVGFFDENLFLYYEENVLSKKLEEKGLVSLIDNQTIVLHNHSVTIDKNMKKIKKYHAQKKSQYYFQTTYQHATWCQRILLKITTWFSSIVLSVYYFFKDIL